jgi:hypothetical protein
MIASLDSFDGQPRTHAQENQPGTFFINPVPRAPITAVTYISSRSQPGSIDEERAYLAFIPKTIPVDGRLFECLKHVSIAGPDLVTISGIEYGTGLILSPEMRSAWQRLETLLEWVVTIFVRHLKDDYICMEKIHSTESLNYYGPYRFTTPYNSLFPYRFGYRREFIGFSEKFVLSRLHRALQGFRALTSIITFSVAVISLRHPTTNHHAPPQWMTILLEQGVDPILVEDLSRSSITRPYSCQRLGVHMTLTKPIDSTLQPILQSFNVPMQHIWNPVGPSIPEPSKSPISVPRTPTVDRDDLHLWLEKRRICRDKAYRNALPNQVQSWRDRLALSIKDPFPNRKATVWEWKMDGDIWIKEELTNDVWASWIPAYTPVCRKYDEILNRWDLWFGFDPTIRNVTTEQSYLSDDDDDDDDEGDCQDSQVSFDQHTETLALEFRQQHPQPHSENAVYDIDDNTTLGQIESALQVFDPHQILSFLHGFTYQTNDCAPAADPALVASMLKALGMEAWTTEKVQLLEQMTVFYSAIIHGTTSPPSWDNADPHHVFSAESAFHVVKTHLRIEDKVNVDYFLVTAKGEFRTDWCLGFQECNVAMACLRLSQDDDEIVRLSDLLKLFIQQGVAFQTLRRATAPPLPAPSISGSAKTASLRSGHYGVGWRPDGFTTCTRNDAVAYFTLARQLLNSGRRSAALMRGGIIWRLSLSFLMGEFPDEIEEGPSEADAAIGNHLIGEEWFYGDVLTDEEVDIICGKFAVYTSESSKTHAPLFFIDCVSEFGPYASRLLWPPPHIWSAGKFDVGAWSIDAEDWFQRRLAEINKGKGPVRNAQGWKNSLRGRKECQALKSKCKSLTTRWYDSQQDGRVAMVSMTGV